MQADEDLETLHAEVSAGHPRLAARCDSGGADPTDTTRRLFDVQFVDVELDPQLILASADSGRGTGPSWHVQPSRR
jgi:hypothetical protein